MLRQGICRCRCRSAGRRQRPSQWASLREDALPQVRAQARLGHDIHLTAQRLFEIQEVADLQKFPLFSPVSTNNIH